MVMRLSPLVLLSVYAITPALLGLAVLDLFVFNRAIAAVLPAHPEQVFLFALLFNVPHLVASFFSFADREYLSFYRSKLMFGLLPILVASVLLLWHAPSVAIVAFILYTEYHVMSQQAGVASLIGRVGGVSHLAWRWTGIGLLSIGYGIAFPGTAYSNALATVHAPEAVPFLLVLFAALSLLLAVQTSVSVGRWFIAVVLMHLVVGYFFLSFGYVVMAIVASRVVHDVTAFIFYTTHDFNRNRETVANILYRIFSKTRIPIFLLTPLLAVLAAYILRTVPYVSPSALALLFVAHYYIESFVWKRGGLHRHQIQVV